MLPSVDTLRQKRNFWNSKNNTRIITMALSNSVEESVKEAESHLRNALAYSARQESPYVSCAIADMISKLDQLIETDKFLQLNGNLPTKDAYTIANGKANWFGILKVVEEGYVKDDEKIDADALLESLKEGNKVGNEKKKEKGLPIMLLEGWYFPPRYDNENKRLEWGTKLRSEDGKSITVNVTTKILGRSGYTSAILVTSPETLDKDLLDFKSTLKNFEYVSGEKYSEWKQGDKVAAYGLGALVLGGAAAVAAAAPDALRGAAAPGEPGLRRQPPRRHG